MASWRLKKKVQLGFHASVRSCSFVNTALFLDLWGWVQMGSVRWNQLDLGEFEAVLFNLLGSPEIDFKESIPPAYVACRAGTRTLFLLGSWSP